MGNSIVYSQFPLKMCGKQDKQLNLTKNDGQLFW